MPRGPAVAAGRRCGGRADHPDGVAPRSALTLAPRPPEQNPVHPQIEELGRIFIRGAIAGTVPGEEFEVKVSFAQFDMLLREQDLAGRLTVDFFPS